MSMLARLGRTRFAPSPPRGRGLGRRCSLLGLAAGPALFSSMTSDMGGGAGCESAAGRHRRGELLRAVDPPADSGPELYAVVDGAPVDDPVVRAAVTRCRRRRRAVAARRRRDRCLPQRRPAARGPTDGQASALVVRFASTAGGRRRSDRRGSLAARGDRRADACSWGTRTWSTTRSASRPRRTSSAARCWPCRSPSSPWSCCSVVSWRPVCRCSSRSPASAERFLCSWGRRPPATSPCTRSTSSPCSGSGSGSTTGCSSSGGSGRSAPPGRTVPEAVERTSATAGVTVAYSGSTVAVSLAGLLVFDSQGLRSLAIGGIGVVLLAVLAARHVAAGPAGAGRPPHPAGTDHGHRGAASSPGWPISCNVVPRSWSPLTTGLLILAAVPFASARFEQPDARSLPPLLDRAPAGGDPS